MEECDRNDPEENQMEQSILRAKILEGLPSSVRSKLAEVVGHKRMAKVAYTDHIVFQVDIILCLLYYIVI